MTRKRFEKLALEALEELPEEFRSRLDNVEIVIELDSPPTSRTTGVEGTLATWSP